MVRDKLGECVGMLSQLDLGWLAGIFDGEGSLNAQLSNRKNGTGGNVYFEVRVEVTSFAMIERIMRVLDTVDVHYKLRPQARRSMSTKDIYRLSVYQRAHVDKLLTLLLPILTVKAKEAEAVLNWYKRWPQGLRKLSSTITAEEKLAVLVKLRHLKRAA